MTPLYTNRKATTILVCNIFMFYDFFQRWLLQVSLLKWLYCYDCATNSTSYCVVGLNAKPAMPVHYVKQKRVEPTQ